MQKSVISWTGHTWNPTHGCSLVSEGCRHCYAETISLRYQMTQTPWTGANASKNVTMKPHKLSEPYSLKEPSRVFVNSMSDLFHSILRDWYIAAIFCVMLDTPQHIYQILTKRPERLADWHERFTVAIQTPEFKEFAEGKFGKRWGKKALSGAFKTPWMPHIWMGTSVEDARATKRIEALRQCKAQVRFLSCEPLIGSLGTLNLDGIHWVIVGGESGSHLKEGYANNPRWMKQAWAREIRDACLAQNVAYFYKQDSGLQTEQRPYLVHEDGTLWRWAQYPNDLSAPIQVDAQNRPIESKPPVKVEPAAPLQPALITLSAPKPVEAQPALFNMPKLWD